MLLESANDEVHAMCGALGGAYRGEAEHRHIVARESEWEVLDGRLLAPTTEQET
ncbi:hypothetical protein DAPPUDRAFT_257914 [Daphnia pulex]|uniref:Uncharacterized protein n=1 Tax=Daphnia pulex TaxID=6669 RepID=E9HEF5_DAPPU|nr:hypothetical protein DAPPUDRAFT_257914 [Daphnia pulex]|eukprot:EFX69835.1 hypothetical protein DAPPUDRAFT_257914 [Daphnia pulex]